MSSVSAGRGGVTVNGWLLSAPPREFVSKRSGQPMTLVELRDPQRLGNSLVIFLDGEAGVLSSAVPPRPVTLTLDELSGGRGRGELTGRVGREALVAALGLGR
jgi:hypothetical protein